MNRKILLGLLFVMSFSLSGCFKKAEKVDKVEPKQLINVLEIAKRPFVAILPHPTGKLITLMYHGKQEAKNMAVELEYLSGNALKGGRTSINTTTFPYVQGFLLGSCSAGGKCSFDKDITTGTIKTRLDIDSQIHVLKSNYTFITPNSNATSDQKAKLEIEGLSKANLVLGQTHGYLGEITGEPAYEPVAITSTTGDLIKGKLSIRGSGVSKVLVYDGSKYVESKFEQLGDYIVITVNQKPWSKKVTIIRDDLKGASEETDLFMIGPVVLVK